VEADAEVIDASSAILRRVALDSTIKVGDRHVVEEFIAKRLGISDDVRSFELMRALDKVEKKSHAELKAEYGAKGFDEAQVDALLKFGELRGSPDATLDELAKLKLESSRELSSLADMLDARGLKNVEYNMSIVRGIDYYTGIVFEAKDNRNPRLGSLFGGGRYDALTKIFGRPDLSATGAAGGIERIAMSIAAQQVPPGLLVYVAVASGTVAREALRVQRVLRDSAVPCELPLQTKPLSKQMEDASRLGATWVVIVGEKEVKAGGVTLRDMRSRKEELLPLPDAVRRLTRG